MTILTWVKGRIDSAHRDPFGGSGVHGHTWQVEAAWPGEPRLDERVLRAMLDRQLADLDHKLLDDVEGLGGDTTAENIAQRLGESLPDCLAVIVGRPDHRAEWRA